jgi:hypothetical protein
MDRIRFSKGPSTDGSRGFSSRRSAAAGGGGGGGGGASAAPVAAPVILWAAIYQESNGTWFPSTLISKPASYKTVRARALEFLDTLPEHQLIAYRNRRHRDDLWPNTDRAISHDKIHEAFPEAEPGQEAEPGENATTEPAVKEYLGVVATKEKLSDYREVFLFPQTSYMWKNCKDRWTPPPRRYDDGEDDDRPYDDEEEDREDYYDKWERECSCDVAGPFFCECSATHDPDY